MYTFKSVGDLCGLLERAYQAGPGETGRMTFVAELKTALEFEDSAAHLYAETALGSNSDNSAGIVRTNAERLVGGVPPARPRLPTLDTAATHSPQGRKNGFSPTT